VDGFEMDFYEIRDKSVIFLDVISSPEEINQ
jgi:hypothetical protein